jgi:hypothetical protein
MTFKKITFDVMHDEDGYTAELHFGGGIMYRTFRTAKEAKEWIKQKTQNINIEIRIIEYEKNN